MVNVDELNEEIKQFGIVVDRMKELPEIYEKVQIQLDLCRDASNELKMTKEDMEKFMSTTSQTLEQQYRETDAKLNAIEHSLDQKMDKVEVGLRDRLSLVESNLSLTLANVTHSIENAVNELNQRSDAEAAESKKRFIILAVGIALAIIFGVIRFFV